MSCDIHAHIELRYKGKWEHYAIPSIRQDYELFGVLAGVRSKIKPIVQPKGLPTDISIITQLDYERMQVDAHTASWFNEDELDKLTKWLRMQQIKADTNGTDYPLFYYDLEGGVLNNTYMFGSSLTAFKHYHDVKYLPDDADAVRLVFWFDC